MHPSLCICVCTPLKINKRICRSITLTWTLVDHFLSGRRRRRQQPIHSQKTSPIFLLDRNEFVREAEQCSSIVQLKWNKAQPLIQINQPGGNRHELCVDLHWKKSNKIQSNKEIDWFDLNEEEHNLTLQHTASVTNDVVALHRQTTISLEIPKMCRLFFNNNWEYLWKTWNSSSQTSCWQFGYFYSVATKGNKTFVSQLI